MRKDRFGLEDAEDLVAGARLLASGGGGDVRIGGLLLTTELRIAADEGRQLRLVPAAELPPDLLVVHVGMVGSPDVYSERLVDPHDIRLAVRALADRLQSAIGAIGIIEIGGLNAVLGATCALELEVPLIDGDIMGRAFPFITQTTLAVAGHRPEPIAIASPAGDVAVYDGATTGATQRLLSSGAAAMGGLAATAMYPIRAGDLAAHGIRGSVRTACELGHRYRAYIASHRAGDLEEFARALGATPVATARIDEVRPRDGRHVGSATLHDVVTGAIIRVDFLEEYALATVDGTIVTGAPEVIVVIDHVTLTPMRSDELRRGHTVLLMSFAPLHPWAVADIATVGPAAYGIEVEETHV
ncbi:DUF917 family protein [Microbacterium sp. ASV49]|uniref:DUF917 family protein n=1 Tax=Microbacterium candidum TaxID=3041922 RepID=A0ABT7MW36_9MICO|nr:DUF917 family protein [Microbacterium sp. ASV49]MDL9978664.1 DUF917 family protein [Microbacterium sp. ASV49]